MRFIDEKTSIKSCFIFYNLSNNYASRENAIKALRSLVKHLRTTHGLLLRTSSLSGVKQTLIKKSFFNCRSIVWSWSAKRESVLCRMSIWNLSFSHKIFTNLLRKKNFNRRLKSFAWSEENNFVGKSAFTSSFCWMSRCITTIVDCPEANWQRNFDAICSLNWITFVGWHKQRNWKPI